VRIIASHYIPASLLKLSGTTEFWRAKKSAAERHIVCQRLGALKLLGLADVSGDAAKKLGEAGDCCGFIEALQSDCVGEFKRRCEPVVQRLLRLFCGLWVGESREGQAESVGLRQEGDDWVISVTFAGGDSVAASISSDQLHKLHRMYVQPALHPQPAARDLHPVDCRFIEHAFACVCRCNPPLTLQP